MIVACQTNRPGVLHVWLLNEHGVGIKHRQRSIEPGESEQLLELLAGLVHDARLPWAKVTGLVVVRGPGPFTPVRTGLVVVNTLGLLKKIPVVGMTSAEELNEKRLRSVIHKIKKTPLGHYPRPFYGRAPTISQPSPWRRAVQRHAGQGHKRIAAR